MSGFEIMSDVGDEILRFVQSELSDGSFPVGAETDLLQEEIIDSLGVFTLIGFLEQRFGVKIDASEVDLDNFRTVTAVEQLVERSQMSESEILGGMDPFRIAVAQAPDTAAALLHPTLPTVSPSGSTGCGVRPPRSKW